MPMLQSYVLFLSFNPLTPRGVRPLRAGDLAEDDTFQKNFEK